MAKKTKKDKRNSHTISFLVSNKPGVLVRIAHMFARRAFNIDALVVSPTVDPRFSRMTITAQGNPEDLDQIIKQSAKLIDVIHVSEHLPGETVSLELGLLKVHLKSSTKATIGRLIKQYRAHIIASGKDYIVIEQTGTTDQLDELEAKLKKFGIIEMVRSGKLAMARGKNPT
jgi:acetolactate synthase I/III small subunit